MPELPDLQVFSKNLTKILVGKSVSKVSVPVAKKLNVSESALQKALKGKRVRKVARVGKELHVEFDDGSVLGLHLMLRGQLFIDEKKTEHKATIIEIIFDGNLHFTMTDFQRQAVPTLNPEEKDAEDALSKNINAAFLKKAFAEEKSVVKTWMMDQHNIRGIGNAYADEILWAAKISPFSICSKIPAAKITVLARSIKKVLAEAEKEISKATPDAISGELRDFLAVHNKKKTESPTGGKIIKASLGGRSTYYTEEQELFQ
jgi:formamidopyrimidine-DNA glycosylase